MRDKISADLKDYYRVLRGGCFLWARYPSKGTSADLKDVALLPIWQAELPECFTSFCRSQLPHKSVNLSLTITFINNKLTGMCVGIDFCNTI